MFSDIVLFIFSYCVRFVELLGCVSWCFSWDFEIFWLLFLQIFFSPNFPLFSFQTLNFTYAGLWLCLIFLLEFLEDLFFFLHFYFFSLDWMISINLPIHSLLRERSLRTFPHCQCITKLKGALFFIKKKKLTVLSVHHTEALQGEEIISKFMSTSLFCILEENHDIKRSNGMWEKKIVFG